MKNLLTVKSRDCRSLFAASNAHADFWSKLHGWSFRTPFGLVIYFYPTKAFFPAHRPAIHVGGGYGRLMAVSSGTGVTDGLRLDERCFTVHRSARRRAGPTISRSGDKCRLGDARWSSRSITELTICTAAAALCLCGPRPRLDDQ